MNDVPQNAVTFTVRGPLALADLPGLCARVCALLSNSCTMLDDAAEPGASESARSPIYCDVGDVAADAVAIEALARLQLAAQHRGCQVRLRNASSNLLDLVALVGLTDVLPDVSR